MNATLRVRFSVRKGEAAQKGIRDLRFTRRGLLPAAGVRRAAPVLRHHRHLRHQGRRQPLRGHHAGRPQRAAQHDRPPDRARAGPASRRYAICSVAVDLKISQLVDVPNMLVSAFLPEDIFTS